MKFSVGYQVRPDSGFTDKIIEYKDYISEVYFSWGDFANGRNNINIRRDITPWEAQSRLMEDLALFSSQGIGLNLLFNATCYGADSQSRSFFEKAGDTIDYIMGNYGLQSVTTTSPLIARFIKSNFENVDVRASVNMCIGTVEGMEYVKDSFDSFYLKRELNRDFGAINCLKSWCDDNGKVLYALANSGCLNNCSAHTFHDNLVSHENEISKMDNGFVFEGICRTYLKKEENVSKIMDYTGFIRPEDIKLYEGIFSSVKLATRVNKNPCAVLDAYIGRQKYSGSVLSLLEPDHTGVIYPRIIENSLIEAQIVDDKLKYDMQKALIKLEEDIYADK